MKTNILLVILILLLLTACRKVLSDDCNAARQKVEVKVIDLLPDYLNSFEDLTVRSISISLFPTSAGAPIHQKVNGSNGEFTVPLNSYSVVIYTSDFFDLDGISYRGIDKAETFEAFAQTFSQNGIRIVEEPDPLFVSYVENFVVDESFERLPVALIPLVYTYRFQIQVQGIQYIKGASATVSGMYTSVYLQNGNHRQEEPASIKTGLVKSRADTTDYLKGEFRSFGSDQRADIEHTIKLFLINGETKEIELNNLTAAIKGLPRGGEILIDQKIVIKPAEPGGNDPYNPGINPWNDLVVSLPM